MIFAGLPKFIWDVPTTSDGQSLTKPLIIFSVPKNHLETAALIRYRVEG